MRTWTIGSWGRVLAAAALAPLAGAAVWAAAAGGNSSAAPSEVKHPAATAAARELSHGFRDAAQAVQPAVVMIKSQPAIPVKFEGRGQGDEGPSIERRFGASPRGMPDLGRFFRELPQTPRRGQGGMGSGLVIDASGVILTNNHVVGDGQEITVRLHDGREFKAAKVLTDPQTDLAVLRIDGADHLTAARLGNSDAVEVGDWVLALGHPFGLEGTVTAGIVSAKGRGIGVAPRECFLQTDAAINPGNSGGPLVNLDGEVIGINTAISSNSGGNEGVGFAIPINLAKWVAKQLSDTGTVHRARLGVLIQPLTHELARHFGLKSPAGVLVTEVVAESPAAKVGIQAGDVIVEFGGKPVASPQELQGLVEQAAAGRPQALVVLRDGKRTELRATPTETTAEAKPAERQGAESPRFERLGMEVQTLTPELAKQLEIKASQGVVITDVQEGGAARRAGLTAGTVVVEVNRTPVKTAEELAKALNDKALADGVLLLVDGPQGHRYVVVRGG